MIAIAILIVLGGCGLLWVISQFTPKGTIIGIGAVIWAAGKFLSDDAEDRGSLMIAGSLTLLGVIGVVLGIVELILENKRKSRKKQDRRKRESKRRRRERRR